MAQHGRHIADVGIPAAGRYTTSDAIARSLAWGPLGLALLFVALSAWSWRRWADPIVDFGNEPYVSWQLAEGRPLYRSIAWMYGPLSPWLNAIAFELFGASLGTLAIFNLLVAAVLAVVVYRFCARHADAFTATVATTVLLVGFVFPHHSEDTGNYNFVWPYAYAATHGTVLLVCGVAMLSRAIATDRATAWTAAGLLLGLTMSTKAEIALAAAATGGVAVLWRLCDGRSRPPDRVSGLVAGCLVPVAACWCLFGTEAIVAPWTAVARVAGGEHTFNARLIGTDDLAGNLRRLALDGTLWSLLAAGIVAIDVYVAQRETIRRWAIIAAMAVVGVCVVRDLPGMGRPLPVLIPLAVAALIWAARRRPPDREWLAPLVLWGSAAWVLLARMLLNVQLHHYGFYLALPGAIFVVGVGVGAVPRLLADRIRGGGQVVRPVAVATIGLLLLHSMALSVASNAQMTVPVGRGPDAMHGPDPAVSPTGTLAATLVAEIESHVPPDATLAVLPDATLLNFLTRRPNPTPYHQIMPPTLVAFGIDDVLQAYDAHPPDYVVLYEWSGDEYGVGDFGSPQWGAEVVAWVRRRYDAVRVVPASGTQVGFSLWRRRDA